MHIPSSMLFVLISGSSTHCCAFSFAARGDVVATIGAWRVFVSCGILLQFWLGALLRCGPVIASEYDVWLFDRTHLAATLDLVLRHCRKLFSSWLCSATMWLTHRVLRAARAILGWHS